MEARTRYPPALALAAVLTVGAGCTRDAPTAVAAVQGSTSPASYSGTAAAASLASLTPAADDALTRVLPALLNAATRDALRAHLEALRESLEAEDAASAQRSLRTLRQLLRRAGDSDAAELDALELLLDRAEELLRSEGSGRSGGKKG